MTGSLKYVITDVFAERKYSGNQLATILDGRGLSAGEMLEITREFNYSETTFILSQTPEANGGYAVRIFTPGGEVDFAGHPTLGTACVIQMHLIKEQVHEVKLNLKVGQIPVQLPEPESLSPFLWMRQATPVFGEQMDGADMAYILGLMRSDLDTRWPVEAVSTGLPCWIVPLKNMAALKRIAINREAHDRMVHRKSAKVILAFAPEGYTGEQTLGVRVFPIYYGIDEDPATGSGNGCLTAYLVRHRVFESETVEALVGQGYEIGRPSLLSLRGVETQKGITVHVGGQVIPVGEGVLYQGYEGK